MAPTPFSKKLLVEIPKTKVPAEVREEILKVLRNPLSGYTQFSKFYRDAIIEKLGRMESLIRKRKTGKRRVNR